MVMNGVQKTRFCPSLCPVEMLVDFNLTSCRCWKAENVNLPHGINRSSSRIFVQLTTFLSVHYRRNGNKFVNTITFCLHHNFTILNALYIWTLSIFKGYKHILYKMKVWKRRRLDVCINYLLNYLSKPLNIKGFIFYSQKGKRKQKHGRWKKQQQQESYKSSCEGFRLRCRERCV